MVTISEATAPPEIVPLTPARWPDLERLFGPRGAHSDCWCMWWRLPNAQYNACTPENRHERFRAIVTDRRPPGLLAYRDDVPIGWCAVAPRTEFPRLERSRDWHQLDEQPVWSLNCFYVTAKQRRTGVATALLHAAVAYTAREGAQIMEAYPREKVGTVSASALYTGTATMFHAAGFREVARRHPERPMMRLILAEQQ